MGVWTVTGLRWQGDGPRLTASDGRREHERAVTGGMAVAWRVSGPRRCAGVWAGGRHRRCPYQETIAADARAVQCTACQNADPGLALARDQILDDGRTYRLYLAWFGEGLLKVGLTAEERGIRRLQEQAALAFTFVGRGRLPAVRRAELTVARAGLARERVPATLKHAGWWDLTDTEQRRQALDRLRADVLRLLDGHGLELVPDGPVVDQVELFGLGGGAPEAYREVRALADGAQLAGALRPAIGGHLFLDVPGEEPLLLDSRLLTGWALHAAETAACAGLDLHPRSRPAEPAAQEALF